MLDAVTIKHLYTGETLFVCMFTAAVLEQVP